jgi:hypothetical protein
MFETDSLWFEIAIISFVFALGNITMGHFEERTPKFRRVGKYILVMIVFCLMSVWLGRTIALIALFISFLPILYVHGWYLPKKRGINGWTGEPKGRYYEFRGWDKNIFNDEPRK